MTETVAIIDYGSGNIRSVHKAFARTNQESGGNAEIVVTSDAAIARQADRLVLPGVGAFSACRDGLAAIPGMIEALEHATLINKRPFLGICVGMQLLATHGHEFGRSQGLGWIAGDVKPLDPETRDCRVPHMGWNSLTQSTAHPVLAPIAPQNDVYFVHSFHFEPENESDVAATCTYGGPIVAAVARDNILGVQFHPEKSQAAGLALIKAFLNWDPV